MCTVLIVDDSTFMRKWLRGLLEKHEQFTDFVEAADGEQAIEQYKQVKPDIVLLDVNMPKVDGLTVLKEIINLDAQAKVVMCSALGTKANIIEALDTGAKDFVVKPYFNSLIEVLDKIS